MSHPSWVRGLKRFIFCFKTQWQMSHPSWVRGLKQLHQLKWLHGYCVAPLVGAWIET